MQLTRNSNGYGGLKISFGMIPLQQDTAHQHSESFFSQDADPKDS